MKPASRVAQAVSLALAAQFAQAQPNAARVVSLQPSLTEAVCALGECARLVGVDRHSNWPLAVDALPRVGSFSDANVEAIVALRPDLVLINSRSRAAERLRALGLRVLVLDTRTLDDVHGNLEQIAQAFGRPGAGEALWRDIQARLARVRAQVPAGWRGRRVYMELHDGRAAASQESFIGETLALLGLSSAVPAGMGAFPKLTPEYVLRADPDVLITPGASLRPPAERPGWRALRAIREQRVCALNAQQAELVMRAGPRIDEAASYIVDCLRALPPPS